MGRCKTPSSGHQPWVELSPPPLDLAMCCAHMATPAIAHQFSPVLASYGHLCRTNRTPTTSFLHRLVANGAHNRMLAAFTTRARRGMSGTRSKDGIMVIRAVRPGNNEEPNVDVSVFRFTLGIPGFDDADLPRLVGIVFGSLLLINHVVSIESITSAQLRSEALGLFLAAVAISLPSIGRCLKGGGDGAKEGVINAPARRSLFELTQSLTDKQKEELAWGSFALLQDTKTNALIVWHRGEVVCARGNFDLALSGGSKALPLLQNLLKDTPIINSSGPLYIPNGADTKGWSIVPKDVKSLLVEPFFFFNNNNNNNGGGGGGLMLLSYQPRSYSSKDRTWTAMLSQKLGKALNS